MTNTESTSTAAKQAAKHTPGPLDIHARHRIDITPDIGTPCIIEVIEVRKQIAPGTWKTLAFIPANESEGPANAALFSTSSDLLEALAAVLGDAKRRRYCLADNITAFARETIAKATSNLA